MGVNRLPGVEFVVMAVEALALVLHADVVPHLLVELRPARDPVVVGRRADHERVQGVPRVGGLPEPAVEHRGLLVGLMPLAEVARAPRVATRAWRLEEVLGLAEPLKLALNVVVLGTGHRPPLDPPGLLLVYGLCW
jgi:hypothetical protein